jgi:tetratricopeptide (TPR) repeat protein
MALGPQYSYLPYNLALLYQRLNELPLAETYYKLAKSRAELNPHIVKLATGSRWAERAEIQDAMGTLETTRKHWSRAEADYRQALADDPQSLNARHNLALMLSRNAKSAEAEDLWKRNLAASPDHLPSLAGYADYLARYASPGDARALYLRVTQLRPDYAGVHRKIAALWLQSGNPQAALAELQQAAGSSPDNPDLLEQIGDLQSQLGNPAAAVAAWKQAVDHASDPAARRRLLKKETAGRR